MLDEMILDCVVVLCKRGPGGVRGLDEPSTVPNPLSNAHRFPAILHTGLLWGGLCFCNAVNCIVVLFSSVCGTAQRTVK